jgi:ectoine hydroxylase-related dioxygenase (phytanoyl-CoA dioxygenase family)
MTARTGEGSGPVNRLPDATVEAFRRDGVVCLRGVLPLDLVAALTESVARVAAGAGTADLSAMVGGAGAGRFLAGVDHWRDDPALQAFACASPLPAIVADLLRSSEVFLYEDSVLVKEPLTTEATVWHQDLGYFHVDGAQVCTTWCPLDEVTAGSGAMRFVRGSHHWNVDYRPNLFVDATPIPGSTGVEVPAVDEQRHDVVSFDLGPGDVTVHHARTLHAAGPNGTTRPRRAVSVRYCGDDARVRLRAGAPLKPHQAGLRDGDRLGGDAHPRVWPTRATA